ncbi:MAG TPA: DUF4149 domain-containing protein [Acidobacteriaceae bacterium]|nr:DUF4149 domain-containing protein [Acidobacteriaceae bacterium]
MKTAIRSVILLCIVLWLGGIMFFPVVAATAFTYLPDAHAAGTVVGHSLRILHYEGLVCGVLIVLLLLAAKAVKALPRSVIVPVVLTLIMLAFTAYSQFSIIPHMERDRIAAGGVIDAAPANNPYRMDFNRLHSRSENVETVVLFAGIILVVLLAANYPKVEPRA